MDLFTLGLIGFGRGGGGERPGQGGVVKGVPQKSCSGSSGLGRSALGQSGPGAQNFADCFRLPRRWFLKVRDHPKCVFRLL